MSHEQGENDLVLRSRQYALNHLIVLEIARIIVRRPHIIFTHKNVANNAARQCNRGIKG